MSQSTGDTNFTAVKQWVQLLDPARPHC
jgi:hypothetical protein